MSLYLELPRRKVFAGFVFLGGLIVILLTFFYLKVLSQENLAIVLSEIGSKFEPKEKATTHFELYEGDKVEILKETEGWAKIKRFDDKLGWIPNKNIEEIK